MSQAYIIDAVRTPRGIGKPGKGALSHLHPQHLGATVLRALKERNDLNTGEVDDVIFSTSTQKGKQGGDLGRMSALAAGYDITASGVTQCDEVRSAYSYASANDLRVHFGLGSASRVERLTIRWPSGQKEERRDVAADQIVIMHEGR